MKNLVVFYSLEGNTKFIASQIAKKVNADILELKTKKEYPNKGFKKYFWGGRSVLFNQKPELIEYDKNINEYDNNFVSEIDFNEPLNNDKSQALTSIDIWIDNLNIS